MATSHRREDNQTYIQRKAVDHNAKKKKATAGTPRSGTPNPTAQATSKATPKAEAEAQAKAETQGKAETETEARC